MAKRIKVDKYPGVYYREETRISGKGTEKVYYIVFKKDGVTREEKVGRQYADNMTPAKASHIRSERIENKRKSPKEIRLERKQQKANSRVTLEFLYEEYKKMFPEKKNLGTLDGFMRNHLNKIKTLEVVDITTRHVEDVKELAYRKSLSDQTVHHILALIKLLVNFGEKYGYAAKPASSQLRFNMPRVDNKKTENMTDAQLAAYLKALDEEADQNAANCLRLALYTGMRRTALFNLKWSDIDFESGMITLRGEVAKKGKTDVIPLSQAARELLLSEAAHKKSKEYVFPGIDGGPRKEMRRVAQRVREKAGLPKDFRPMHGLRHTFASKLISSGKIGLATLQKLLTHENPSMTNRYAHLEDEAMKRAASIADEIFSNGGKNGN